MLAQRIAQARRDAGLTKGQLAEKLKVSRASVGNWEKTQGKAMTPRDDNLEAIAKHTGVSKNWLLTGHTQNGPDWSVTVKETHPHEPEVATSSDLSKNINDSFFLELLDVARLLSPEEQEELLAEAKRRLAIK